jgi:hypothetical protein
VVPGWWARAASWAAPRAGLRRWWRIGVSNPPQPNAAAQIGVVDHTFKPEETLIAFLWFGLRDGWMSVVKK